MKLLRLILACYVFAFFAIIVPGHTRGIVTVAGSQAGIGCCASDASSGPTDGPTPTQRANCAVCHIAAMYTVPPVYVFYVEPLDRVEALNDFAVPQLFSLIFPTPFWPVGPPAIV